LWWPLPHHFPFSSAPHTHTLSTSLSTPSLGVPQKHKIHEQPKPVFLMQPTITIPPNNAQNRSKHLDGGKNNQNAAQREQLGLSVCTQILLRNLTKTASKCSKNESEKEREQRGRKHNSYRWLRMRQGEPKTTMKRNTWGEPKREEGEGRND
jgi:hypothetical protein